MAAKAKSEKSAKTRQASPAPKKDSPTAQGSKKSGKSDVTKVAKEQTQPVRLDDTGWRHTTTTAFPPVTTSWPAAPISTSAPTVIYVAP